ncbi:hypothetical protein [Duganella fentianensis]|uniref:hypothetical protein n=1 Tax=Duganella fentianensis TaxID=2692177 RepID=UPI0032B154B8
MSEEKTLHEVATYSKDTPTSRPDLDGRAGVFVPTELFDVAGSMTIRKGSGIAGFGNPDGSLTVYFENNRFDDSSLHKWENKVRKAYDRMVANAPTVNKAKLDPKMLEYVGFIDGQGIQLKHPELLQQWLELSGALDTAPAGPIVVWPKSKSRF